MGSVQRETMRPKLMKKPPRLAGSKSRTSLSPTTSKFATPSTSPTPQVGIRAVSSRRLRCPSSSDLSTRQFDVFCPCGRRWLTSSSICSLMMHGRNNGKKLLAVRIVAHAFEIIHLLTDQNPIQVRTPWYR